MCTGVDHAGPISRLESCFSAPLRARLRSACSTVAAVCDRRVQLSRSCETFLPHPCRGKDRRRSQNAATKAVDWSAPLWSEVNSALEGDAGSELAAVRGSACTELWTTRKSSLQSNRKRCWSTALQNVLYRHLRIWGIQFFIAQLQS